MAGSSVFPTRSVISFSSSAADNRSVPRSLAGAAGDSALGGAAGGATGNESAEGGGGGGGGVSPPGVVCVYQAGGV
ncbi:hypothetical protein ACIHFE_08175 [Streptomyces sp. NPDC052396]|uniref:hypothetical protein n=1 Tax=Streptomyces sp. NPDC052396 TaxID=3365689 RepID=UPI0037D948AA